MIVFVLIAAFVSTLVGGLFALHLKDRLHLILGFSAGAILGAAFFDLLPEALDLAGGAYAPSTVLAVAVAGFAAYLVLDRTVLLHTHGDTDGGHELHGWHAGAGSLALHSFLDGVGIGLAFNVSTVAGVVIAAAVLTHDFSDGINTVSLVLRRAGARTEALRWLFIDAAAPALGLFSTRFFTLPKSELGLTLALFSGFFLYIGASDLIPESYHAHPKCWTTVMTLLGIGTIFAAVQFASL